MSKQYLTDEERLVLHKLKGIPPCLGPMNISWHPTIHKFGVTVAGAFHPVALFEDIGEANLFLFLRECNTVKDALIVLFEQLECFRQQLSEKNKRIDELQHEGTKLIEQNRTQEQIIHNYMDSIGILQLELRKIKEG